jgi:hypothetical protein
MCWFRPSGLVVTAVVLLSCTAIPPPEIPFNASESAMESLAGRWSGNYWGGPQGRSGLITFELEEGDGHAHGEVIMLPEDRREFSPAYRPTQLLPSPQPLRVEFIRAADGQMTGTLEPYRDPGCECLLSTSFMGSIHEEVIEGSFVTVGGPGHLKDMGNWKVERIED